MPAELRGRVQLTFKFVALTIALLWHLSATALTLPHPTFAGVGERDGQDRVMLTFAEPLPPGFKLSDHISASSSEQTFTNWAISADRKITWLLDVPDDSKLKIKFTSRALNRTVFGHSNGGQIILAARQPTLEVPGKGPVIPLSVNPTLPVQLSNVEAVQLELLRVSNPKLVNAQFSPFDTPKTYWLNSLSGAFEKLGIVERLPQPGPDGFASQLGLPLPIKKPGWYLAVLKPAGRFGDESTVVRQILYTDLAIRVLRFEDGLSISVTRFSNGTPVTGAAVALDTNNNNYTGQTDDNGTVFMSGSYSEQTLITVSTTDDESYLPLSAVPLDLDGFDVAGASTKKLEVFATANRNLVAPGAAITITAIMRGVDGVVLPPQPLSVKWQDPRGETLQTERQPGNPQGLWQFTHAVPQGARPGLWRAQFYTDPRSDAVGEFSFNVDDFVPERVNVTLPEQPDHTVLNDTAPIMVSAEYLHGASATGLNVEADLTFTSAWKDAVPGWIIGERFELYSSYLELNPLALDDQGQTVVTPEPPAQDIAAPVTATLSVAILDGDSRVQRQRSTILWPTATMIGIKPHFNNDGVAHNSKAEFSVALFKTGNAANTSRQVEVNAYRDTGDGYWVFDNAEGWVYQRQFGQQPVYNDSITIDGNPKTLSFATDWGRYRIEVIDRLSGARTQYHFYAGWWGGQDRERAFKPMGLDAKLTSFDADNLQIDLSAPYDGSLQIQLVTDRPLTTTVQAVSKGSLQLNFDASDAEKRQDAYLLLTLTGRVKELPARAMAILPLRWPRQQRHLQPSVTLPDEWRPDTVQKISVTIPDMRSGHAWLMVADKGITNITNYKPTDPFDFIYRKRKLGASVADFHDRFYLQLAEQLTRTRSGGDTVLKRNGPRAEATERLTLLHTSKPVAIENGKAVFELQLPGYTGEAMVSVAAVDGDRFGQTITSQRIVSPITIEWKAPQAMVHGDKLYTSVLLRNNQKTSKTIELTTSTDPRVSLTLSQNTLTLAPGQQQRIPLIIAALENAVTVGASDITITADAGDEPSHLKQQIFLRAPGSESVLEELFEIAPDESISFDQSTAHDWIGLEQQLLVSTGLPLDVTEHYKRLVGFPYGCSEQTISQVMSLLIDNPHIDRLVSESSFNDNTSQDASADVMLDTAVSRLYRRQLSGGGISLWDNGELAPWVTVYAADFLQRLAASRHEPTLDERLQRLLAQVHGFVARPGQLEHSSRAAVVAYAALISAKAGKLDLSTLDRAARSVESDTTPTGAAHLAQAFFILGDSQRSEAFLSSALSAERGQQWYSDYGSSLSDASQLLISMGEMRDTGWQQDNGFVTQANQRIKLALASQQWYSTQERMRLVQAATLWRPNGIAQIESHEANNADSDGRPTDFIGSVILTGTNHQQLKNNSTIPLYVTRRLTGYRTQDLPIPHDKLNIKQQYFNADGSPVSLTNVEPGDLLIVSSQLENKGPAITNALFVDPLPAGFVLENPRLGQGINLTTWKNQSNNSYREPQIDYERFETKRYSAVFALHGSMNLVYQMRAVAAGTMADPGASLEDLYAPQRRTATGSQGQLLIRASR